ncbi:MAG: apolipoprotein N-acyltransferase [Actinomycetota bacterium]|nr:apolipoprotein N-acyltransferase [Actinomycetota bacterium]
MLRRLFLAVLGGGALVLAFPGYDVWPLAPVAVALLAMATRGARWRGGLLVGFVFGLVFFLGALHWSGIYVGAFPWVALACSQAAFTAVMGAVCAVLQARPPRRRAVWPTPAGSLTRGFDTARVRPLVVGLAWVAQEALRDRLPYGGFPWVRLAFSQADSPLGRLAALGGAPAVTFGVALTGGLLAAAAGAAYRAVRRAGGTTEDSHSPARPGRPDRGIAAGVGALLGAGVVAVSGLLVPLPTQGEPARIMAVQGNVPQAGLEFNAQRRAVLDNHVQATIDAAATGPRPDLVVWPENASDIDPLRNADAATQINRALAAVGAPIVVGSLLDEPLPHLSNASLLYEPGRGVVDRYVKQHPVPFAEYIPQRSFFRLFSDKVDLVRADFAAGTSPVVFRVPSAAGPEIVAGPVICFEVAYDDLVRDNVTLGANLLMVQTNNATFGFTDESVQQLAISRIRAMEHGRSVVHVSTVGVSALITPDGTAHQASSLFTRDVLRGDLPLRSARTVATVVGPWPEYAACALLLVLILLAALATSPAATQAASGSSEASDDIRGSGLANG